MADNIIPIFIRVDNRLPQLDELGDVVMATVRKAQAIHSECVAALPKKRQRGPLGSDDIRREALLDHLMALAVELQNLRCWADNIYRIREEVSS